MSETWIVSIPIAGTCTYTVEADSKEEAIEKAWGMNADDDGEVEWEFYSRLTSGNVLHPWQNEIEAYAPGKRRR